MNDHPATLSGAPRAPQGSGQPELVAPFLSVNLVEMGPAIPRQVHGLIRVHVGSDGGRPEQQDRCDVGGIHALVALGVGHQSIELIEFLLQFAAGQASVARLHDRDAVSRCASREQTGAQAQRDDRKGMFHDLLLYIPVDLIRHNHTSDILYKLYKYIFTTICILLYSLLYRMLFVRSLRTKRQ